MATCAELQLIIDVNLHRSGYFVVSRRVFDENHYEYTLNDNSKVIFTPYDGMQTVRHGLRNKGYID